MANYRISEYAKKDLRRIYRRGVLEFGEVQADLYFDAFFERFAELASQPHMYPAVDDIREEYRRSVCGVNSIFFRIVGGTVEFMMILVQRGVEQWL